LLFREPRLPVCQRRSGHSDVGSSEQALRSTRASTSHLSSKKRIRQQPNRIRQDRIRVLSSDADVGPRYHPEAIQRYLEQRTTAESMEACNHPANPAGWKGPAAGHVVPTDIAHVDDEQADGKTGHKPTNVVL